jgi:predicted nucleic acid-binding protein
MEQGYLVDTNIFIAYFNRTLPEKGMALIEGGLPCISIITRIELLGWTLISEEEVKMISSFLSDVIVFSLSEPIIVKTIVLRQSLKIKTPDAIIAATALTHNLILLTRNTSDFRQIADLRVLNPYEL